MDLDPENERAHFHLDRVAIDLCVDYFVWQRAGGRGLHISAIVFGDCCLDACDCLRTKILLNANTKILLIIICVCS